MVEGMKEGYWVYYKKRIFVILENNRKYSGFVNDINLDEIDNIFTFHIVDKYNNPVSFTSKEIKVIEVEN